ncbi:uncharacterized protein TNCV_3800971 [Trichonephila clavipes]|nr:uncharacterized protein TNCV_3800971 [Trichonephila clavipes]
MSYYQVLSEFKRSVIVDEQEKRHIISEEVMEFGFSRTTISRAYREYGEFDGRVRIWSQPHESMNLTYQHGTDEAGGRTVMARGGGAIGPLIRLWIRQFLDVRCTVDWVQGCLYTGPPSRQTIKGCVCDVLMSIEPDKLIGTKLSFQMNRASLCGTMMASFMLERYFLECVIERYSGLTPGGIPGAVFWQDNEGRDTWKE